MITVYIRLQELLKERNMTQKKLVEITGLRAAAISEICNNLRKTINREHLEKIADTLGLKDVSELIEFRYSERKE